LSRLVFFIQAPMSKTSKAAADQGIPASYEDAMAELERIVADMESSELSLEASLAAHKRGLELARHCQDLLTRAQQQVTMLEESLPRPPADTAGNGT
jgi:exodeoxyribonuclease VII small subunit